MRRSVVLATRGAAGMDTDQIAAAILTPRARRQPLPAITDSTSMTMTQAYQVQQALNGSPSRGGAKDHRLEARLYLPRDA